MVQIENDCVGCPQGCIYCGRKRTPHYYCDVCGAETRLYDVDGQELCADCVLEMFSVVEGSDE